MEDTPKSFSKSKVIKVRKKNSNASHSSSSEWTGIRFTKPKSDRYAASASNDTDDEEEIRVINLEQEEEPPPVMLLFPDLKEEQMGRSVKAQISTTDLLRLIKGKKANTVLLKPAKKLIPEESMPVLDELPSTELLCIAKIQSDESVKSSTISVAETTVSDYDADESSVE